MRRWWSLGGRLFGGILLCSLLLLATQPLIFAESQLPQTPSVQAPSVAAPKKCSRLIRLLKRSARFAKISLLTAAITHPLLHELNATLHDAEHIGGGIYLNQAEIENHLTYQESALLVSSPRDQRWREEVAELFAHKLNGDYEAALAKWWTWPGMKKMFAPEARSAYSYFEGQSKERGICRTKALILAWILNAYGIEAIVESGLENGIPHAWVRLPDPASGKGRVIDPTNSPRVEDAEVFYKKNNITRIFHPPMVFARLGALVR